MAITQATSSVLAANAALTNLNAGASIAFTKPVTVSGNLTVDTNTLFVDSVNDRVGIGTTTPTVPLQISTIVNGTSLRLGQDSAVGRLEFGNINVAINRASNQLALQGFDGFTFGTQNGEMMRLTSSSRVGIGTTTPYSKLHIAGSPALVNTTMEDILYLQRPFNAGISFGQRAVLRLGRYTTESKSATRLDIGLREQSDDTTISTAPEVTVMTLRADRKVGINTTTPNESLTVVGNISTTGNVTASNLVYTTDDQTIAGLKTFSNNIVGNGTANRLPNQLAVASSDIITKGLADSRYTSRNERITDDTTFVQTTWEQFLDFDDQYNQDLAIAAASGASTFGASPVFGDVWSTSNVGVVSFSDNDLYTHRGVFLVRGPTANNQAFYFHINRTTIPYSLSANRIDEFTSRIFITGADFATQGYFKIGPVPKGGTGGGDSSLTGGLIFNPFLHTTNLVLGVNKSTAVTPFTFTTTAANVDFLDTGFNFTNLLNKWVNITYKIDRTVNTSFPTITIIITRDNVVLFQASYDIATHPVVSTWVRRTNLFVSGASNEIGLQSGHFTYTAPNRSQLFIDYLHYKVTGTSAAPSNWNSLRF